MNTATPEAPAASAPVEARLARLEGTVEQISQTQRDILAWVRWIVGIQFTSFIIAWRADSRQTAKSPLVKSMIG